MPDPSPELDAIVKRIRDSAVQSETAEPDAGLFTAAASFDELLASGSDADFVAALYATILQRRPDAQGRAGLLEQLRAGVFRSSLIAQVHESPEARALGVRLSGIGSAARIQALVGRIKVKPRLLPLGHAIERLYSAWRYLRLGLNGQALRRQGAMLECLAQEQQRRLSEAERRKEASEARSQQLQQRLQQLEQLLHRQNGRIVAAEGQLLRLRATDALPQPQQGPARVQVPLPAEAQPGERAGEADLTARLDAYYVAFEDAHRGTEQSIRERLNVYLERIANASYTALAFPVVDIGCGRGEWLRLLIENGFQAVGVDLNREMVEHCRNHGLQAHHTDALAWLMAQPDESFSVVSAFHVVEHLPFDLLFQLIDHARRVLIPGGLLLLETPNPENILVGSHTFYHDFSHRNPVTPVSLQFLLEYQGFAVNELLRLHPYPEEARVAGDSPVAERINGHFCGPQDYGIVASRPRGEPQSDATLDRTQLETP